VKRKARARQRRVTHYWARGIRRNGVDPNPDYDASDELEYFFSWLPWALRGVYPPPAYPPV